MKFMLVMQGTRSGWESMMTWTPAAIGAHIGHMRKLNQELRGRGELVAAEGLDVPANAKVVQAKPGGGALVTDGPFAETKEFLAGFWIVDVESAQRAHEIAALASAAPGKEGAPMNFPIEIRQVMSGPDCGG